MIAICLPPINQELTELSGNCINHMVINAGFIHGCSCSDDKWKSWGSTRCRTEIDKRYSFNVRLDSLIFILRFRLGNLQRVTHITAQTAGIEIPPTCVRSSRIFDPSRSTIGRRRSIRAFFVYKVDRLPGILRRTSTYKPNKSAPSEGFWLLIFGAHAFIM